MGYNCGKVMGNEWFSCLSSNTVIIILFVLSNVELDKELCYYPLFFHSCDPLLVTIQCFVGVKMFDLF